MSDPAQKVSCAVSGFQDNKLSNSTSTTWKPDPAVTSHLGEDKKERSASDGGWPKDVIPEKYMGLDDIFQETEKPLTSMYSSYKLSDKPLMVLTPNTGLQVVGFLFIAIMTIFFICCVIIPVLIDLDFNSVWPKSDKITGRKAMVFGAGCGFILILPHFYRAFNLKRIFFFDDRVELHAYILNSYVIYYNNMRVNIHGDYAVSITKVYDKTLLSPFKWFKNRFIESFSLPLRKNYYYSESEIKYALEILTNKASEVNMKIIF